MKVKFKIPAEKRKTLARKIAELTGEQMKYLGVPSCAYRIGEFTLSKYSTLSVPDDCKNIGGVLDKLSRAGYESETTLNVEMPKDKVNIPNLHNLIKAKGKLIGKALGVDELPVIEKDETVSFPWFHETDPESVKACTHFISAICEMSLNTRISSKAKKADNEKYAFRCFLLRLGFIGDEYKAERKVLLRNLNGSSAFRNGGVRDEISG